MSADDGGSGWDLVIFLALALMAIAVVGLTASVLLAPAPTP